jgi:hypothetical protein
MFANDLPGFGLNFTRVVGDVFSKKILKFSLPNKTDSGRVFFIVVRETQFFRDLSYLLLVKVS